MNRRTTRFPCCLAACGMFAALLAPTPARAEQAPAAPAKPATLPSTQPAAPDLHALVKQLGADDFKDREAAAEQLRKCGKDALPALNEAAASTDPEVQARARGLMDELKEKDRKAAEPEQPALTKMQPNRPMFRVFPGGMLGARGGAFVVGGNGAVIIHSSSTLTVQMNGTRDAVINENANVYKLHTGPDGLKMSVTEGGQTKEYAAKDADDLKKTDPEAYKIYEKRFAVNNPVFNGGGMIQIRPAPQP